jgi:hypothetical protein
MKQETVKEVAERYVDSFEYSIVHPRRVAIKSFINGAKWQQERSYSEEEVLGLLLKSKIETSNLYYEDMKNWFQKFKKK